MNGCQRVFRRIRISPPALAAALLGLAAVPLPAQTAEPESLPGFGEVVEVRVINIEVVVTDGEERVEGLGADDFQLLIDGRPVPIEFFTEIRGGQTLDRPAASGSETPAVPAIAPGESVGQRILVFIDDYFATAAQRNRALRELEDQVPRLGADDRMAIVAFDGQQIDLLTSWTRSPRELGETLDKAQERRAYRRQRVLNQRNLVNASRRGVFDEGIFRDLRDQSYGPGGTIYEDVAKVTAAAASSLRAFARPEGRRVMLLLSESWQVSRAAFRPLIETANRLGYTLYPVDLPGVHRTAGDAEYARISEADLADYYDLRSERVAEDALYEVADATGGRALIGEAGTVALESVLEDVQSYYWLGFSPEWRENDEVHSIEVEVRRKGLKVRSRRSFSDLSRSRERTMMVESAQLFDLPMPASSGFGVSFGEPAEGGYKKAVVPVRLEFPLDRLTAARDGDQVVIRLEVRVAATDDLGHRADIPVLKVELRRDKAPLAGELAKFDTHLLLRRRPHHLLFTIHDPVSGDVLSQRTELDL